MSKRVSGNTLFNYFSPSGKSPKVIKTEPKCDEARDAGNADKSITKRHLSPARSSDDENVSFKNGNKKRRRILSRSDSESDSPKKDVDSPKKEADSPKKEADSPKRLPGSSKKITIKKEKVTEESTNGSNSICEPEKELVAQEVVYTHNKLEFLKPENIKDAKGRKLNDPHYDNRTLYVPKKFLEAQSPGHRQWWDLKSHYYDCVLFFKVGKFYELYHMDADVAVKELECTYMKGDFAHSGFPEISGEKMATKLIEKGYKVARVEQTETPEMMSQRCKTQRQTSKFDKVVKREICRVTNIGTQIPGVQSNLDGTPHKPNYMLAIAEKTVKGKISYGICFIDTSIGELTLGQFSDEKNSPRLRTLVSHFPPVLILYDKETISSDTRSITKTVLYNALSEWIPDCSKVTNPDKVFKKLATKYYVDKDFPEILREMSDTDEDSNRRPKPGYELAVTALGMCLWYLQYCFIDELVLAMARYKIYVPPDAPKIIKTELLEIKTELPETFAKRNMVLDSMTLSNLRLVADEDSLLHTLDQCCTKFGRRLLHNWVCAPSCDITTIKERQEAITEFLENSKSEEIKAFLSLLPDFERQLSQIHGFGARVFQNNHPDGRAILFEEKIYSTKKIQTFIALLKGFKSITAIPKLFSSFTDSKLLIRLSQLSPKGEYPDLNELLTFFETAFDHKEALEKGVIAPQKGVDSAFDSVEKKIAKLECELEDYLAEQKRFFGCDVKYFGNEKKRYQLEIPESRANKTQNTSEYSLEGQKKGSQPVRRYSTAKTKDFLKRMISLEEERSGVLKGIASRIFNQFSSHYSVWKKSIDCIAQIDVLLSLAAFCKTQPIVCIPEMFTDSETSVLEIEEGYHPCFTLADNFIPNDLQIIEPCSLFLLTGPNMGGKSTLMRLAGLLCVLAHMGAHVPARSCKMSLVDRIFTRLGAQDDILAGQSTFLVELTETSSVIHDATKSSLVLLDELGRGTATYDGTAIAVAVANFLAGLGCRSIFSTHYHNLINFFHGDNRVNLGHMSCMVENEDEDDPTQESVTLLYKLAPGSCPKSFGFNAAKLAGMPNAITKRAAQISKSFLETTIRKKLFTKILCNADVSTIRQIVRTRN